MHQNSETGFQSHRVNSVMGEDRRKLDERRDWLRRLRYVNGVQTHIESSCRNTFDLESLAESLSIPICVVNRIFNEVKDDYIHRFPWLLETI